MNGQTDIAHLESCKEFELKMNKVENCKIVTFKPLSVKRFAQ